MIEGQVNFSHTTKYLGVAIDSRLNWSTHWNNVVKKEKECLFMVIPFVTRRWGPNQYTSDGFTLQ